MVFNKMIYECAALLLAFLHFSCATSVIKTGDPTARVFVDGKYQGMGPVVEADAMGGKGPARINVVTDDDSYHADISRRFTFTTFIGTVYTYGLGLLWFWELPSFIDMSLYKEEPNPNAQNPWLQDPKQNPWLTPVSQEK
ncbi:MAG: hypothetical protein ACOH5I_22240 [Oligoflexus sp.]